MDATGTSTGAAARFGSAWTMSRNKLALSVKGRVDRNGVVHVMPRGDLTLKELIGLSADTGAINYRTHLVLSPDSPTYFNIIIK